MINDIIIRKYTKKEDIIGLYNDLLRFMSEIYISTNGKYPAMEWLSPEEKPKPEKSNFYQDFFEKYGWFLKWRLMHELDEIFLAISSDELIGVVGLNYNLRGKEIPWIPKEFMMRDDVGFIELFAVRPEYRGKGIGTLLFKEAIKRLNELNKRPCVVTFPNLEAVKFYEKMGGRLIEKYDIFVMYCF